MSCHSRDKSNEQQDIEVQRLERLAKVRNQDQLVDGIERYSSLEHLDPGELRIRGIRISVQSSQLPLHCRLAALAELRSIVASEPGRFAIRKSGSFEMLIGGNFHANTQLN